MMAQGQLLRRKNGGIKIRLWTKSRVVMISLFVSLLLLTGYTFLTMDYGTVVLSEAFQQFFKSLKQIFLQPRLSGRFPLQGILEALFVTLGLAFLTTLLGAVIAFFLSLATARNLGHPKVSTVIRMVMSFIRAVPTILWVLVFSIIIGLGPSAAIVGMTFHSIAYLTKVYSESLEAMDDGVLEALRASGASWWQVIFQAVLPTAISAILSWTFIRFEINFTNAIAVGAAAGAGGLGFQLAMISGFYFDFHEIGVLVYLILAVVFVMEMISLQLKKRYLLQG